MEREEFLKLSSLLGLALLTDPVRVALAMSPDDSPDQDESAPEGQTDEIAGEDLVSNLEDEEEQRTAVEPTNRGGHRPERVMNPTLEGYLDRISETKALYKNILMNTFEDGRNIFSGFKNLSKEQILQDFDLYFPMYWAAWEEYNIPWFLAWIVHVHESAVSRNPNNPAIEKNSRHKGAIQRDPRFYDEAVVEKAVGKWEFLKDLPQRQTKKAGFTTDDCAEILFFADKVRRDADESIRSEHPDWSDEECFLQALYSYSAAWPAKLRINHYRLLKSIFNQ